MSPRTTTRRSPQSSSPRSVRRSPGGSTNVPRSRRPTTARRPVPVHTRAARAIVRPFGITSPQRRVRFAVVGLGYFAQAAVLPAFKRADSAEVVALVSDDATKLKELGDRYKVDRRLGY